MTATVTAVAVAAAGVLLLVGTLIRATSMVDWFLYWWRIRRWLAALAVAAVVWALFNDHLP